jgi:hypothetical protein
LGIIEHLNRFAEKKEKAGTQERPNHVFLRETTAALWLIESRSRKFLTASSGCATTKLAASEVSDAIAVALVLRATAECYFFSVVSITRSMLPPRILSISLSE